MKLSILIGSSLFLLLFGQELCVAQQSTLTTWNQVSRTILRQNQLLEARQKRVVGLRDRITQANSLPNPGLNYEVENFGGDNSGLSNTEHTVSISQKIELGGKRSARTMNAKAQRAQYNLENEGAIARILSRAYQAYHVVVRDQALVELQHERIRYAKRIVRAVKDKVAHGAVLEGEGTRASIALELLEINKLKFETRLRAAKRELASLWNATEVDVGRLRSRLPETLNQTYAAENTVRYRVLEARIVTAKRQHEREKSLAVPDITLRGGYRRFAATDDDTFVAQAAIQIPIFNRNEGKVSQAKSEYLARQAELAQEQRSIAATLTTIQQTAEVLLRERTLIKTSLRTQNKKALEQMREAYELGRVGYLDLVSTQNVFFDNKQREIMNTYELQELYAQRLGFTGMQID